MIGVRAGADVVLFSVGLPGRFADWCDEVMVRLARQSGLGVLLRTWPSLADMFSYQDIPSTLDELGRVLIGSEAGHIVMGSRQPDHGLRVNLARTSARFLVALDDPREAVADILAETDADAKMVVRAVANSCPLVMQYTMLPEALRLHAEEAALHPADAVLAIAQQFGISIDSDAAAALVADLAAVGQSPSPGAAGETTSRLPSEYRKMVDGALLPYRGWFAEGRLDQLVWTRELFYLAADAGRSPTEPLDVSGGCRILIYGPYIQLPAGSWTAQVVLGFSQEAVGYTFFVDAFAGGELAATTFQPARLGIYTAELTFSLGEPSGKGVEVRVMVMSEDARGQLAFGHVILSPIVMHVADAWPTAGDDFAAVLEL
jgi:hypothetical protein